MSTNNIPSITEPKQTNNGKEEGILECILITIITEIQ